MKPAIPLCALLLSIPAVAFGQTATKKPVTYANQLYLNQEPPGMTPKVFAPEKVSKNNEYEYGSVFSKDGREFYYAVIENKKAQIRCMKFENNQWTEPTRLLFSDQYEHNDPFLSPDEQKLFFISDRPMNGQGAKKDIDIWYVKREKNGWSQPINAGKEINSDKNEYYISFTRDGKMYFASNRGTDQAHDKNFDIYSSQFARDQFGPRQKLGDAVNSEHYEADVFVSPDEKYLIYCAERPDGLGKGDLYISFKDDEGQWQQAKNMGNVINSGAYEFCPFVSADGKYLFFSRSGDIYWVDAAVINSLK